MIHKNEVLSSLKNRLEPLSKAKEIKDGISLFAMLLNCGYLGVGHWVIDTRNLLAQTLMSSDSTDSQKVLAAEVLFGLAYMRVTYESQLPEFTLPTDSERALAKCKSYNDDVFCSSTLALYHSL